MVSSNLAFAIKLFSNSILKGIGVSNEAQRITGASRMKKKFSAIHAAISPPMTPIKVSPLRINTLPALCTASQIG